MGWGIYPSGSDAKPEEVPKGTLTGILSRIAVVAIVLYSMWRTVQRPGVAAIIDNARQWSARIKGASQSP